MRRSNKDVYYATIFRKHMFYDFPLKLKSHFYSGVGASTENVELKKKLFLRHNIGRLGLYSLERRSEYNDRRCALCNVEGDICYRSLNMMKNKLGEGWRVNSEDRSPRPKRPGERCGVLGEGQPAPAHQL